MCRSTTLFLTLSLSLALSAAAQAAKVRVPQHAATINAGLALAGPGGTVTVDEGTYHENVVIAFDNQRLRGHGDVKVDGCGAIGLVVPFGVTGSDIEDIQFRDCSLGMVIAGSNTEVDHCKVKNTTGQGILVVASNVTIENTSVKDAAMNGVYLAADGCMIHKCTISRTGDTGVVVLGNSNSILGTTICQTAHEGIRIGDEAMNADNNLVQLCDVGVTGADGIELRRLASGCTINENEIHDTTCDAIDVGWQSDSHSITRNVIHDAGDQGLELDGPNLSVSHNKIYGSLNNGIEVENGASGGMYFKNKVMNSWGDGFCVAGTGNTFTKNKGKYSLGLDRNSFVPMAANVWIDNVFLTSN